MFQKLSQVCLRYEILVVTSAAHLGNPTDGDNTKGDGCISQIRGVAKLHEEWCVGWHQQEKHTYTP